MKTETETKEVESTEKQPTTEPVKQQDPDEYWTSYQDFIVNLA